jgi:hypothetical protein
MCARRSLRRAVLPRIVSTPWPVGGVDVRAKRVEHRPPGRLGQRRRSLGKPEPLPRLPPVSLGLGGRRSASDGASLE